MKLLERFWQKVAHEPNTGCYLWYGGADRFGYGRAWDGKKVVLAHRLAYELTRGPIQDGLELDHLCRIPACVNPDHLEAVTHRVNMTRSPAVWLRRQRVCSRGHTLTDHTKVYWEGTRRRCKACAKDKARKRYNTITKRGLR